MPDASIVPLEPGRRPNKRPRRIRANQHLINSGIDFATAMDSWETALRGRNRSDHTITAYRESIELFARWLADNGLPDDVTQVRPEDIQRFLAHEVGRPQNKSNAAKVKVTRPATAGKHYRHLRAFFNYLIKAGERTPPSPVHQDDAPKVPDVEKPPLTDEEIIAILDRCKGKAFTDIRDTAIIRLLIDSGPRRSGIAGVRYTPDDPDTHDVNLKQYRLRITLKGGDEQWIPVGKKTAVAIDRYVRMRARHPFADEPWLWLGDYGPLTGSGLYQMIRRRGAQAGILALHPHQFRRTSATQFLDSGASSIDAMHVYGWKSEAMVKHYTKETARERARNAHARLSPGDRF